MDDLHVHVAADTDAGPMLQDVVASGALVTATGHVGWLTTDPSPEHTTVLELIGLHETTRMWLRERAVVVAADLGPTELNAADGLAGQLGPQMVEHRRGPFTWLAGTGHLERLWADAHSGTTADDQLHAALLDAAFGQGRYSPARDREHPTRCQPADAVHTDGSVLTPWATWTS